ncbi:phosphoribosylformylglycinamidine synthase II [Leptolyngbya boryana NIES-2135]|jgi:phosphoribosylformylglycinamidine synthase II|uniref:Phosphoribosylformylglycinamidine synthase subunit PurL n=1 Tax=Leptolyngbya boryana NIES-2135 TaxID=1973484 RepID=A0A1Z4JML4_LEPBY|nr:MULTISPECIES: phosphoribosylformylglycinamidine synthase subunit PurL [Leptolyngbya]BAY57883.1 phosphoribosylformylglycinamidine synthase II [Leptolyngbya boryana NIES-2135]MBD2367328.1 phosphoribosylformylglycinamidine synthase subunit PurL [Leptolyngbya sp. FACHB-161]MBD2373853.1 phosphoribosylformylglycinamidine synthase subunit PurL [Leptolyngbya sp. FACHB-238]MBD2398348.1 phosphoribosylformylglycinamidine synthase subunit PurL [Leptolyngbya sp. FACHB-239]MBD2404155.1 phosphoribosylform
MSVLSSAPFSAAEIASEGIQPEEYEEIVRRLGRHPNKAELGMFGVMWSEHCCYKNSRPLLKQFPTEGARVLVGPGENAGVVDLGDGLQLAFKIESHNHPSAVEPFQGAATGVGGILRDIFTMGARPIALLNSLRFGTLDDARTRRIVNGVVAGISHYGNCVGVPTVGGEVYFDRAYSGNPLVNVMALGLMETTEIVKSGAKGLGNPVLYVGSTTGRDGMGGASFASAELSDESMDDRPAVQVGDPFLEKSLIEACLEAFKTGAVVAAQDMGAAGITCSTSEMAAKGGVGIELDLDLIPVRETGMVPYEYLLSESQERMLFVAEKGREQELIDIFEKWGLHAVVAGKVIEESIVRILFQGEIAAEIPATALADNTPIYHRELLSEPPEYAQKAWAWTVESLPDATSQGILGHSWNEVLGKVLKSPTIASKQWVYRQYDHQVQNNTVLLPGGADAAVVRVRPLADSTSSSVTPNPAALTKGVAATVDCNPRYVYLHPYEGAKAAVAEAARNLSCVGADPIAITDNLNFGSPEKPIGYWQLAEACRGLSEACREFETPVTGGNVSLYNETLDSQGNPEPIYPTPVVGMVGFIPNLDRIAGQSWKQNGDVIYLLGSDALTLGGSEYLAIVHQTIAGKPPIVDFDLERKVQAVVRSGIRSGLIQSAHDCAEGGIAIALAESCFGNQLGATIDLAATDARLDQVLFGEGGARILVSVQADSVAEWEVVLQKEVGDHWRKLGTVGGDSLKISIAQNLVIDARISELFAEWSSAIENGLDPNE